MTDQEKSPKTPPPPAANEPQQQPAPEKKPDRIQLLREKRASKPKEPPPPRVPSLEKEQTYGFGKKIDAFDAEMEHEMEEALAGFADQDLLGKEERARKRATPESPRKKGR